MNPSTASFAKQGRPGVEAGLAAALVIWRLMTQTPGLWWRDWILLLSAFWIYSAFRSKSPVWPTVLVSVMSYLLGIYALGQYPHILASFGAGR